MSDPSLKIAIKRAYDAPERGDGVRILVDRLWPRGLRKDAAHIDQWCKEVAPTTELRRFYGHRPDRFAAFRTRYRAELRRGDAAAAVAQLVGLQQRRAVTLLTAARDLEHSDAAVLAQHLRAIIRRRSGARRAGR